VDDNYVQILQGVRTHNIQVRHKQDSISKTIDEEHSKLARMISEEKSRRMKSHSDLENYLNRIQGELLKLIDQEREDRTEIEMGICNLLEETIINGENKR